MICYDRSGPIILCRSAHFHIVSRADQNDMGGLTDLDKTNYPCLNKPLTLGSSKVSSRIGHSLIVCIQNDH